MVYRKSFYSTWDGMTQKKGKRGGLPLRNIICKLYPILNYLFQARMKLPKKRRRVMAVKTEPRKRVGGHGQGSVAGYHRGSGGHDGPGLHRRMNAIKAGGGGGHQHSSHTNHTTHGDAYRLPNAPHEKMGRWRSIKAIIRGVVIGLLFFGPLCYFTHTTVSHS